MQVAFAREMDTVFWLQYYILIVCYISINDNNEFHPSTQQLFSGLLLCSRHTADTVKEKGET